MIEYVFNNARKISIRNLEHCVPQKLNQNQNAIPIYANTDVKLNGHRLFREHGGGTYSSGGSGFSEAWSGKLSIAIRQAISMGAFRR